MNTLQTRADKGEICFLVLLCHEIDHRARRARRVDSRLAARPKTRGYGFTGNKSTKHKRHGRDLGGGR